MGNVDWGKGRADRRQLITAYRGPNYPLRAPIMAPFAQIIHIQYITVILIFTIYHYV